MLFWVRDPATRPLPISRPATRLRQDQRSRAGPAKPDVHVEGDPALAQNKYAIGERHRLDDIVRDQHRGEAMSLPDALGELMHLHAG